MALPRLLTLSLAGLACCAGPAARKMAWPETPRLAAASPARRAPARGGGLEPGSPPHAGAEPPSHAPDPPPADLSAGVPNQPTTLLLHWPIPATGINSLFGFRRDPFDGTERRHNGVDLEAEYGEVVSAAADGLVVWAGWNAGHGREVVVSHAGGYETSYSHLSQVLAVTGTEVHAGQAIGRAGNSGRSTGAHLHFEVTHYGVYLDPLDVLGVPLDLRSGRHVGGRARRDTARAAAR